MQITLQGSIWVHRFTFDVCFWKWKKKRKRVKLLHVTSSKDNCFWLLLEFSNLMGKWPAPGVSVDILTSFGGLLQMAVCWTSSLSSGKECEVEEFSTGRLVRRGRTIGMCISIDLYHPCEVWGNAFHGVSEKQHYSTKTMLLSMESLK